MRKYLLPSTLLAGLALLGVFEFDHQSMTFGKTLREADAAKIWGGTCTVGWVEFPNGACTTYSPGACTWDSIYGCVNQCEINCTPVTTFTAGGDLDGMIAQTTPCEFYVADLRRK